MAKIDLLIKHVYQNKSSPNSKKSLRIILQPKGKSHRKIRQIFVLMPDAIRSRLAKKRMALFLEAMKRLLLSVSRKEAA